MNGQNLQLMSQSLAERSKTILAGHPMSNWADNLAQLHIDFLAKIDDLQNDSDKYRSHVKLIISENARKGSRGNAPGHGHTIKGIWDSDNGSKAGKTCAWCAIWHDAVETDAAKESK